MTLESSIHDFTLDLCFLYKPVCLAVNISELFFDMCNSSVQPCVRILY